MSAVNLAAYRVPPWHDKGRGFVIRALWHWVNATCLQNPLNPSSAIKAWLLRVFGAKIGKGVVLKPGINVKHPWCLEIGDHTWIGENVWLDNASAPIKIGSHVCLSQGVYLCTGNHDWSDPAFGLIAEALTIEEGAWIGARASVFPCAKIATHTVVAAGSVISKPTEPYTVYAGNPAAPVRRRHIRAADQTQSGPFTRGDKAER